MTDSSSRPATAFDSRLTTLVWASAMGTYLLVAVGGVTSLLEGGTACGGWPTCSAGLTAGLSEPAILIALGHRFAAVVVGLLLAVTLAAAVLGGSRRVSGTLALATVLYPFQVWVGAMTATPGTTAPPFAHLVLGVAIFALALLALLWHLEAAVDAPDTTGAPTPVAEEPAPAEPAEQPMATEPQPAEGSSHWGLRARASAYLELTKPRLMWLLCLVAVAAMALAAGPALSLRLTVLTVVGGMLAVGASGTFNNVLERDVDKQMDRTDDRPLVEGRIPVRRAVAFGLVLAALAVALFVAFVNLLAAVLAVLAILFYSLVYTLVLKPHTRQNIVLGGAVGAFPALIGWAAVENEIGLPALALGAVIFLWTPAHFYNLALAYRDDYAAAGFPMLPVVSGGATTRRHILLYLGATLIGSVALGVTTTLDWLYALTIVLVGGAFLWAVIQLFQERTESAAFRTFHASNAYLGTLLLAILVDALVV